MGKAEKMKKFLIDLIALKLRFTKATSDSCKWIRYAMSCFVVSISICLFLFYSFFLFLSISLTHSLSACLSPWMAQKGAHSFSVNWIGSADLNCGRCFFISSSFVPFDVRDFVEMPIRNDKVICWQNTINEFNFHRHRSRVLCWNGFFFGFFWEFGLESVLLDGPRGCFKWRFASTRKLAFYSNTVHNLKTASLMLQLAEICLGNFSMESSGMLAVDLRFEENSH